MTIHQALSYISLRMASKLRPIIEIDCHKNQTGHVDFHAVLSDDTGEPRDGLGATLEICMIDLAENLRE